MFLLSTGQFTNDYTTYIMDSLVFAFTIKPASIPMDQDYGIVFSNHSEEDSLNIIARKVINKLDTRNKVKLTNTRVEGNKIILDLNINGEDFSLEVS